MGALSETTVIVTTEQPTCSDVCSVITISPFYYHESADSVTSEHVGCLFSDYYQIVIMQ